MKMTKGQWRMLMSTILDIHNDAAALEKRQVIWVKAFSEKMDDYHVCITDQLQALEDRLAAIEDALGETSLVPIDTKPDTEPRPDMHNDDIDYANLRWRTQNEDGTWRDCID